VYLRGDGAITYQELMEVIDGLKDGGIQNIGMVTDLPGVR
jgi:biopolymer transport protein ExbD